MSISGQLLVLGGVGIVLGLLLGRYIWRRRIPTTGEVRAPGSTPSLAPARSPEEPLLDSRLPWLGSFAAKIINSLEQEPDAWQVNLPGNYFWLTRAPEIRFVVLNDFHKLTLEVNGTVLPCLPLRLFTHKAEKVILVQLQRWQEQHNSAEQQGAIDQAERLMFGTAPSPTEGKNA